MDPGLQPGNRLRRAAMVLTKEKHNLQVGAPHLFVP